MLAKFVTVNPYAPACGIVEAHEQIDQGAFAATALTGQPEFVAAGDFQINVVNDPLFRLIGKADIFKNNAGLELRQRARRHGLFDRGLLGQQMHEPLDAHAGLLQYDMDSAQAFDRLEEHDDTGQEGDQVRQFDPAIDYVNPERRQAHGRKDLYGRINQPPGLDPLHGVVEHLLAGLAESFQLFVFQAEGFDDPDSGKGLDQQAHLGDVGVARASRRAADFST